MFIQNDWFNQNPFLPDDDIPQKYHGLLQHNIANTNSPSHTAGNHPVYLLLMVLDIESLTGAHT